MRPLILLASTIAMMIPASSSKAVPSSTKHSIDFDWKYEMDSDPTIVSNYDLDNNSQPDWSTYPGGAGAYAGGVATIDGGLQNEGLVGFNATDAWSNSGITGAAGYTVELSVKLGEMDPDIANNYASAGLYVTPIDTDGIAMMLLRPDGDSIRWSSGAPPNGRVLSSANLTDAYHSIRIAKEAGAENYWVWLDGALLNDDASTPLPPPFSFPNVSDLEWPTFSGAFGGVSQVDYLRFTSGAHAPAVIPEPSSLVLFLTLSLATLVRRTRLRSQAEEA